MGSWKAARWPSRTTTSSTCGGRIRRRSTAAWASACAGSRAGKPTQALPAFVGFDVPAPGTAARATRPTDDWPIQSYQWKDLFVPEEREVSYEIVPMTGTPGQPLTPRTDLTITTGPIAARDRVGDHRVVFNRGIISTQSLTEKLEGDSGAGSRCGRTSRTATIRSARRSPASATKALTSLLTRARKEAAPASARSTS